MKRLVLIGLMFVLVLPCFAWGGDIDGLWWNPEFGTGGALMMRENAGTVLIISLNLAQYGTAQGYDAFIGSKSGNIITVEDTYFSTVDLNATVTLTSTSTAIVKMNRCSPKYYGYFCPFPTGVTFNIEKAF